MRLYRALVMILAVLLLAAPVATANAAEAAAPAMAVQLWPEGEPGQMLAIVSAELPPGQKLPVTVDIPLIEGAEVLWVGEILGADPSQDIAVPQQIVDGEGGKMLRVKLTKGTVAQYEASIPGLKVDGVSVSSSVKWVQATAAPQTSFAVRLPAGAGDVEIRPAAPGDPQTNDAGETLHTLPDRALKPGESVTVDIGYEKGTGSNPINSAPTLLDRLPLILGGIALAAAALAVWLHSRTRSGVEE